MDYLADRGVTAVHHLGTFDELEVFRIAQERGLLKTRIYACTPLAQWQRLADGSEGPRPRRRVAQDRRLEGLCRRLARFAHGRVS